MSIELLFGQLVMMSWPLPTHCSEMLISLLLTQAFEITGEKCRAWLSQEALIQVSTEISPASQVSRCILVTLVSHAHIWCSTVLSHTKFSRTKPGPLLCSFTPQSKHSLSFRKLKNAFITLVGASLDIFFILHVQVGDNHFTHQSLSAL